MKNNKLTLKALKEELENLKKSKSSVKVTPSSTKRVLTENSNNSEVAGHDIKGSYINRIYMKSSMFWLYIITGVLSYAHKLPYIRKLISLLAFWYGRTTIWKILVKIRRIFIIINAMIGVMLVFKTTGFSSDNILAGFAGMGYTYIELITNFTKRLFNWFIELFDYKIVPNIPNTPSSPTNPNWWPINTPITDNRYPLGDKWLSEIRNNPKSLGKDLFQNPFNINISTPSPWYKEWSTYLWVIGIVSVAFIGYKFIIDPLFIESLPKPSDYKGKGPEIASPDTPTQSNFKSSPKKIFSLLTSGVWKAGSSTLNGIKMLNPLYWLPSATNLGVSHDFFMDQQSSVNFDNRFYPFTENNPFNPWYTKLRLSILGETNFEQSVRNHVKRDILNGIVSPLSESPRITHSMPASPSVANIGLGFGVNTGDAFEASTSYFKTVTKIASLPGTPKLTPINILPESIEGGINTWKSHSLLNTDPLNVVQNVPNIGAEPSSTPEISTSKTVTPKPKSLYLTPENKYSVLSEETI
jgi:hypothetical protein